MTFGGGPSAFSGDLKVTAGTSPAGDRSAHPLSPLTINSDINAAGDITLTASGSPSTGDNLTFNASVTSTGGGTGNLALSSGATYSVEINGLTGCTQYDRVNVTGTVNLGSSTLGVSLGFSPAVGNQFTIVSNDGADPVVGQFSGLPEGSTISIGGSVLSISYHGGDGNDVVLTASTPTAVTVSAFGARASARGIELSWRTGSEARTLGFYVWRRGSQGAFTKLSRLLQARGRGGVGGARYTYTDRSARPGQAYRYRLQAVRSDGAKEWIGPVTAPATRA